MKITIVSHYYNHHEEVNRQIKHWESMKGFSNKEIEVILIDDFSEKVYEPPTSRINIRHIRIDKDIPWNQGGCRNLGAYLARGEWLLIFDIDQYLNPNALAIISQNLSQLDKNTLHYLKCKPIYNSVDNVTADFHPNSYLVNTDTFRRIGMYDEDFCGHYGYEDLFLPIAWERNGGKRTLLGGVDFFDADLPFETSNLDRDLEYNKQLSSQKLMRLQNLEPKTLWRPEGILRFSWHEL